jgi:hypothetical protein
MYVIQDYRKLTPKDLVEWLACGDFYFILGHIHQTLRDWDVRHLYDLISRLTSFRGFPQHRELCCPIFTQDKFAYIRACHDITIPTLKFELSEDVCVADSLSDFHGITSHGVAMSVLDFISVRYCS